MTGNLVTVVLGHTATLLPNGTVLVAGGTSSVTANAEIYNPTAGTWAATGNLNTTRSFHTATLLNNGKVLIAGGYINNQVGNPTVLASAEIYDPSVGTWIVTGSMITARSSHTATLLNNGTVLVAGGIETYASDPDDVPIASAEIYDPVTGTWSATGSLNIARADHTANLLPNGTVLVAGSYGPPTLEGVISQSAEIYDPATAKWTVTGSMMTGREWHASTLLSNGTVLVSGGNDNVYQIDALSSAEIYFFNATQ